MTLSAYPIKQPGDEEIVWPGDVLNRLDNVKFLEAPSMPMDPTFSLIHALMSIIGECKLTLEQERRFDEALTRFFSSSIVK